MTPTKTSFAGLERLAPGDPLSSDGYAFQDTDRAIIDRLLRVGAVTHRHDAHAVSLTDPTLAPTLDSATSGGNIPGSQGIYVTYTLLDADGGETAAVAAVLVTTAAGYQDPTDSPAVDVAYDSGLLLAGNYDYAITVTDGLGGETALGPTVEADVDPGFPNGTVSLSNLAAAMNTASNGADGASWRLWRSQGGSPWYMIGTGSGDTFTDDGVAGDCSVMPPDTGTTQGANTLSVTVPTGQPTGVVNFNIYASYDGSFTSPALLGVYTPDQLGVAQVFTGILPLSGAPPAQSTCFGGANQINPDTDMLDFPWKRPVATSGDLPTSGNETGDTRITMDTKTLWSWDGSAWQQLGGTGSGGGSAIITDNTNSVSAPDTVEFDGAGGASVVVDNPAPGRARVTVTAGGGGGTGGGGTPGPVGGQPGSIFSEEHFVAPDGTALSGQIDHTAQIPAWWQSTSYETGAGLQIQGNAMVALGAVTSAFAATQNTPDVQVSAIVQNCQHGTTSMGVWARLAGYAEHGYLVEAQLGRMNLYAVNGTTLNRLTNTVNYLNDGVDTKITLRCMGSTISMLKDDVVVFSTTDTTWDGSGYPVVGVRGSYDGTNAGSMNYWVAQNMDGSALGPVMWGDPVATSADLPAVGGVYAKGALVETQDTGWLYVWQPFGSYWNLAFVPTQDYFLLPASVNADGTPTDAMGESGCLRMDGANMHLMCNSYQGWTDLTATRMTGTTLNATDMGLTGDQTVYRAWLGGVFEVTDATAVTITIPTDDDFGGFAAVGALLDICQTDAGVVTVAGETGVTLRVPSGHTPATSGQWSTIRVRKRAANEWVVSGDLA